MSDTQAEIRLLRAHNEALQRCGHPRTALRASVFFSRRTASAHTVHALRAWQFVAPKGPGHLTAAAQGTGARADDFPQ